MLDDLVQVQKGPFYPAQLVLELACAAQRTNGSYIKTGEVIYTDDGKAVAYKYSNKELIKFMLEGYNKFNQVGDFKPQLLNTNTSDTALVEDIRKHYRKLAFSAVAGDNDFQTVVHNILQSETIASSYIGYAACLPSVYAKDVIQSGVKKASKNLDEGYLGDVGSLLTDLDCEILESTKSKNFEGYLICAIINNKMANWFSKHNLNLGPCVVIKAKVKEHSTHWKHGNPVTRLNFVKAAQ
jgi:hypothetical protein